MTEAYQTGQASGTSGEAKARAQEVAGTATDEARHVAGDAAQQAREVAGEAASHARDLLDEARGHLETQSRDQLDRLVEMLRTAGDELQQMAQQGDGVAGDLARQVADRVQSLSSHLEGRQPTDLLDDVRGFARRRPGTFLLGALAAGVAAGRLARGAKEGTGRSSSGAYGSSPRLPQTTGDADPGPLAGRPVPTGVPQAATVPGTGPAVPNQRADDLDVDAEPTLGTTGTGTTGTGLGGDPTGYGARPAGGGTL